VERDGEGWPARGARGSRVARALGPLAASAALLASGMGALAGCGAAAPPGAGPGTSCGTTHTAADVPVIVKVAEGTVNCATAMRVENDYAAVIRAGHVRGNGGGAPVVVNGWTCQGYPTPEVLSTGNASQCHTSGAAIVAVLPVPAPSSPAPSAPAPSNTVTTG
jgi:hypothetical protein